MSNVTLTIYEVNKILSSENKSKIIAHFWRCQCERNCVEQIGHLLGINRVNLSKHLGKLLKFGVLKYKQVEEKRVYSINPKWRNEWFTIVEPILQVRENAPYACSCSPKG